VVAVVVVMVDSEIMNRELVLLPRNASISGDLEGIPPPRSWKNLWKWQLLSLN